MKLYNPHGNVMGIILGLLAVACHAAIYYFPFYNSFIGVAVVAIMGYNFLKPTHPKYIAVNYRAAFVVLFIGSFVFPFLPNVNP